MEQYLDNVREIERRIQRVEARNATGEARDAARRAGRRARFVRRAREADVRPAGAGLPGRRHPRVLVQDGPRRVEPRVSRERRVEGLPPVVAPRQQAGERAPSSRRSTATTSACCRTSWTSCRRSRKAAPDAARQEPDRLRLADGRRQRAQPQALPAGAAGRRPRPLPGNVHHRAAAGTPMANVLLSALHMVGHRRRARSSATRPARSRSHVGRAGARDVHAPTTRTACAAGALLLRRRRCAARRDQARRRRRAPRRRAALSPTPRCATTSPRCGRCWPAAPTSTPRRATA